MRVRHTAAGAASVLLAPPVAGYIAWQRNCFARRAVPLPSSACDRLRAYFTSADLARARVVEVNPIPIAEPPFASILHRAGLRIPTLAHVGGITFDHVLVVQTLADERLLFHELVHVVQYRLLGVPRFARLYVRGLLRTGSYEEIPLEQSAYELEHRFATLGVPFSVESQLARWQAADRF